MAAHILYLRVESKSDGALHVRLNTSDERMAREPYRRMLIESICVLATELAAMEGLRKRIDLLAPNTASRHHGGSHGE